MSGLFRFTGSGRVGRFNNRSSSSTPQPRDPDYSAFGLDDDEGARDTTSDDEDREHVPLTRHGQGYTSDVDNGVISLGDEVNDPLTHASANGVAGYNHASTITTHIPGGYDFEPQPHQGGGGGAVNGNSAHSHHRAHLTGNASTHSPPNPISTSGGFTAGAIYARFAAAAAASATNPNISRSNRINQDNDDDDNDNGNETSGLLFDAHTSGQDEAMSSDHTANTGSGVTERYPPSHVPLPARPPQFGVGAAAHGRVFGGGQGNDGVFANLSAKPDGMRNGADYVGGDEGDNKDEVLPAYEIAAMDTTPPYWETTVITPGGVLGPDDICVDGLPVGNLFGFAWNLLVSMSFQFVGFLLTYLLHTTHAAKNGSRAGLGITMIQLGFYLKERADHPERFLMPGDMTGLDGSAGPGMVGGGGGGLGSSSGGNPDDPINAWSWWGGVSPNPAASGSGDESAANMATATLSAIGSLPTQLHGALSGAFDASDPDALAALRNGSSAGMPSLTGEVSQEELMRMSAAANEWMAFMMISIGSFLIIGAILSYWRAVRWAKAVREGNGPQQDSESLVGRLFAAAA